MPSSYQLLIALWLLTCSFWLFLGSADSTTINDITFTKSNEVAAVTFGGQMKVWDLRQPSDKPERTMLL